MKFTVRVPGGKEEEAIYGHWYGSDHRGEPMVGQFILAARKPDKGWLPHRTIATITRLGTLRVQTNHVDRPSCDEGSESTAAQ